MSHCADVQALNLPNLRLFSRVTIPPGSGIGPHQHENETEYYLLLHGSGVVTDNLEERHVEAGDLVITRHGESHSLRNVSLEPLEFVAFIVLD